MSNDTTSTKRCSKCQRELPATREYFYVDTTCKDGFQYVCKECKGFDFGARTYDYPPCTQEGFKRCKACLNEYPATIEYFHRNSKAKDGLQPRCKQCLGSQFGTHRQRPLINSQQGYRVCTKCKQELLENNQYFHNDAKSLGGLSRICKDCVREYGLAYRNEHHDNILEGKRKYGKIYEKRPYVRARRRERGKQRYANDPIKGRLHTQKRIARRKSLPDTLTKAQWEAALSYFNHTCAICGNPADFWTVIAMGHIVALNDPRADNLGTTALNVVPMCHTKKDHPAAQIPPCNNAIKDKHAYDWITQRYGAKDAAKIIARIETYFAWVREQDGLQNL